MKIVQRYVLISFLKYLTTALIVLIFIYTIINLFDNLGRYLSQNVPFLDIIIYYFYLSPSYIVLLIPIASIIGVFFIFGFMTKNRELVVLKSCGMDINQLFLLILLAGIIISIGTFIFQETIGVWAQSRVFEHKSKKIDRRPVRPETHRRNFFYYGEDNWIYYIKEFEAPSATMKNVILWRIDDRQKIEKRIDAPIARYSGVWQFENGTIREFDTLGNEVVKKFLILKMPELMERPQDFLKRVKPIEEMNFLEIYKFVKRKLRAGEDVVRENVELNYRFSFPLITLILLLIALPISVVLRRGGIAIGLGISIALAFLYWGFIQSCRAYGYAGVMTPFLAAWLPNSIFSLIGITTILGVRR